MDIEERLEESIENKYMQDYKGKKEMKLTTEESIYILKRKDFNAYVEEKAIQTILSELEKQDKIIDLMSERLTTPIHSKEWVKRYYEEKVGD